MTSACHDKDLENIYSVSLTSLTARPLRNNPFENFLKNIAYILNMTNLAVSEML